MPGSLFPHQFMLQIIVARIKSGSRQDRATRDRDRDRDRSALLCLCLPSLSLVSRLSGKVVCRALAVVPGCCSPSTLLLFVFPGQQPEEPLSCGCESADRKIT